MIITVFDRRSPTGATTRTRTGAPIIVTLDTAVPADSFMGHS